MAKRSTHAMPAAIRNTLKSAGVEGDYRARPHYQRNDYLGWIAAAKRDETRQRRIAQMIRELRAGGVYMGMKHRPSAKS